MQRSHHFLTTLDHDRATLQGWLDDARALKAERAAGDPHRPARGRAVALVFFNPSLRTRSSFDIGAHELGLHAVVLEPGKGSWPIEFEPGAVMDGDAEEHVAEVAQVLSRYADLICVRAFPTFVSWEEDRRDKVIEAFAAHASVPVINMETITHPCQELAHVLAMQERFAPDGDNAERSASTDGKKYVLTWTYHPKPLNTAVANSGLIAAAKFGFDVTLLCPREEYRLDERYMSAAQQLCEAQGRSLTVTHDIDAAYDGADVVYAKSWGALPFFGKWDEEKPLREAAKHFLVDEDKMAKTRTGLVSHCLPARRNVKLTDAVFDSPGFFGIDEAENRLHVQKAVMRNLLDGFSARGRTLG